MSSTITVNELREKQFAYKDEGNKFTYYFEDKPASLSCCTGFVSQVELLISASESHVGIGKKGRHYCTSAYNQSQTSLESKEQKVLPRKKAYVYVRRDFCMSVSVIEKEAMTFPET